MTVGAKTFHKKQLAEVTNLFDQHPEILQDEKKAAGQVTSKTERNALRSKSTGQFHSPEKTFPDDVISHGVAVGPPGTKGSNSHRSKVGKKPKKLRRRIKRQRKRTRVKRPLQSRTRQKR